jgi:hypothetical protein
LHEEGVAELVAGGERVHLVDARQVVGRYLPRERLHLGMDIFDKLPRKILNMSDRLIDAVTFLFGLYLVGYGWDFAMMMQGSILAPRSCPTLSSTSSCRSPEC